MRSIFRVKFDRIDADEREHLAGDTMNEMIPLTVANTLNQTVKNRIEAKPNQSLRQVIRNQNLSPKGEFDVYDQDGKVVSNESVSNFRDRTVYVGVARVAGGGIPRERLKELKIEYPSMRPVKQHLTRKEAQMIRVRFPSNSRTRSGFWDIVIYCPNASSSLMHTYVLNFDEITQSPGVSLYPNPPSVGYAAGAGNGTIPGSNRRGHWVCHGQILPHLNQLGNDPIARVGAYLNHIQNLLNQ